MTIRAGNWIVCGTFQRTFNSFGFGFSVFATKDVIYGIIIDLAFWTLIVQVENVYFGDTYV